MLILALNALHDPVTAVSGRIYENGELHVNGAGASCELSAVDHFTELLFTVGDHMLEGLQGVDAFVLASGPTQNPLSLQWEKELRSYVARLRKPLHEVDELEMMAGLALVGAVEGSEVFPILEGDLHPSAGFRLGKDQRIERVLPTALRSLDVLASEISQLPAPRASFGSSDGLWVGGPSRYGAGLGFKGQTAAFGNRLQPLPWMQSAACLRPSAVQVLCHFVSEQ